MAENNNEKSCKHIYMNGVPFKLYDIDAHDAIDEINTTLQDNAGTLKTLTTLTNSLQNPDGTNSVYYTGGLGFKYKVQQGSKVKDIDYGALSKAERHNNGISIDVNTPVTNVIGDKQANYLNDTNLYLNAEGLGLPYFELIKNDDKETYRLEMKLT